MTDRKNSWNAWFCLTKKKKTNQFGPLTKKCFSFSIHSHIQVWENWFTHGFKMENDEQKSKSTYRLNAYTIKQKNDYEHIFGTLWPIPTTMVDEKDPLKKSFGSISNQISEMSDKCCHTTKSRTFFYFLLFFIALLLLLFLFVFFFGMESREGLQMFSRFVKTISLYVHIYSLIKANA